MERWNLRKATLCTGIRHSLFGFRRKSECFAQREETKNQKKTKEDDAKRNTYIHYNSLHYITLHYITTLHYIRLQYIPLHNIALHYITLHCITLHYITYHDINTATVQPFLASSREFEASKVVSIHPIKGPGVMTFGNSKWTCIHLL